MSYVFPQKDTYKITLIGKPNAPGAFQSFSISWNFDVTAEVLGASKGPPDLIYVAGIFLGIPLLTSISIFFLVRSSKKDDSQV